MSPLSTSSAICLVVLFILTPIASQILPRLTLVQEQLPDGTAFPGTVKGFDGIQNVVTEDIPDFHVTFTAAQELPVIYPDIADLGGTLETVSSFSIPSDAPLSAGPLTTSLPVGIPLEPTLSFDLPSEPLFPSILTEFPIFPLNIGVLNPFLNFGTNVNDNPTGSIGRSGLTNIFLVRRNGGTSPGSSGSWLSGLFELILITTIISTIIESVQRNLSGSTDASGTGSGTGGAAAAAATSAGSMGMGMMGMGTMGTMGTMGAMSLMGTMSAFGPRGGGNIGGVSGDGRGGGLIGGKGPRGR